MSTSKPTPDEFSTDNENVEPLEDAHVETPTKSGSEVTEFDAEPVEVYDIDPEIPEPLAAHTDENKIPVTKLVRLWSTTILGIIVLTLLIVFIAQNQDVATIRFFAMQGQLNLGLALFISALGGGLIVTIMGAVRVLQIRATARRERKAQKKNS